MSMSKKSISMSAMDICIFFKEHFNHKKNVDVKINKSLSICESVDTYQGLVTCVEHFHMGST